MFQDHFNNLSFRAKALLFGLLILVLIIALYFTLNKSSSNDKQLEQQETPSTQTETSPSSTGLPSASAAAPSQTETSPSSTGLPSASAAAPSQTETPPALPSASAAAPVAPPPQEIDKNIWQFFNNSYCSDGEYAIRETIPKNKTKIEDIQDILKNVINNPSYIAVYIYDGNQTSPNTWNISYISKEQKNTVTLLYSRYGSMTPFEPENRYIYVNIQRASSEGVYKSIN